MPEEKEALGSVRFGRFDFSADTGELRKDGQRVKLSGQAIQVLAMLAASPGKLVTREDLQQKLWPGASYGDPEHGLNAAVNKLRETLGDSATEPKYIETVPGRGYRFIGQLEPETLLLNSELTPPTVAPAPDRFRKFLTHAILVAVGFAVLLSLGWLARKAVRNPEPALTAVPLTALPGNAVWPSFSPDGQQIAFGWDNNLGGSATDFFVQSVGGSGPPVQLTHAGSRPLLSALTAWTPDGKWITYARYNPQPEQRPVEIVLTPAPMGGPELVLQRTNFAQCGLSWSPDGKYLAFSDRDLPNEPYAVFLLERDTLERRRVTTPPKGVSGGDAFAAFSHDGKRIAFVRDVNGVMQVAVLTLSSSSTQILASGPGTVVGSVAWDPSDADIIYSSDVSGSWRLWRVASTGGEPRPLGEDGWAPAVSTRAHRLAYGRGSSDSNIWRIGLGKETVETRSILIASSRQDSQPEFSPDENKIVFASDRSGSAEIWTSDSKGDNPLQITQLGNPSTGSPRWSPNGKLIAFDSRAQGKSDIYSVGLDGAAPRLITQDGFDDSRPSWSADGIWIYYQSNRSGEMQLWKVPAFGGQPIQVTTHGGSFAFETSDGKALCYLIPKQQSELWQMNLQDGEERRIAELQDLSDYMGYQITDEGFYFAAPDASGSRVHSSLQYLSFMTKKIRTVAPLGNMTWANGISISKDGRTILYSQQDHINMNIMLVENFH